MTVTHKKAAQLLHHRILGEETITDIYYEGNGNRNENAFYVGEAFVLKYTVNPGNIIHADDRQGFLDFDLAERNARIYDPCYAATAVLSETFGTAVISGRKLTGIFFWAMTAWCI